MAILRDLLLAAVLYALAVAAQAGAHVQPMPFPSLHALASPSAREAGRRATRSASALGIVNGNEAAPGQFPHQVGIFVDLSTFCGGALISTRWILTAANCVGSGYRSRYTAFLGAHDINLPTEKNRISVTTTAAYPHEEFVAETFKNDVALLLLPRDVKTSAYIKPINLPPKQYARETFAGADLQLSGWGYQSARAETIAPTLQYMLLKGVAKETCVKSYSYEVITDDIICAVGPGQQSPCQGDTGNALILIEEDTSFTHIGVASFVPGGCMESVPSGFTRTASYLDWISSKTGIPIR